MMEEENERILRFALQQQEREENRMAEKRKKEEQMSAVQQNVCTKIFPKLKNERIFLLIRITNDYM